MARPSTAKCSLTLVGFGEAYPRGFWIAHCILWASINWSSCFIESAVVHLISVRERMFFSPELTLGELTNGIFNTALLMLY